MKFKYYFYDYNVTNSDRMLGMEDTHKPGYIASMVVASVLTVILIILLGLSHATVGSSVFFTNQTVELLYKYETVLTPTEWAVYIMWIICCVWQILWLVYALSTIRRYTSYGYLYIAPGHMHPSIFITYSLGVTLNIIWLFIFDIERPDISFAFALASSICLYVADGIALRRLYVRGPVLQREEMDSEIWLVRVLVQNGLDVYATWMLYVATLNLNIVLMYNAGVTHYISATILLTFLLVSITGFFFLDVFAIDVYSRYVLGGYIALALPLAGSISEHWVADSSTETLLAATLAVTVLVTVGKICVIGWR